MEGGWLCGCGTSAMKHSSFVRAFVDDDPITLTFYVFAGRRPPYRPPQSVCFRRVRACVHTRRILFSDRLAVDF